MRLGQSPNLRAFFENFCEGGALLRPLYYFSR